MCLTCAQANSWVGLTWWSWKLQQTEFVLRTSSLLLFCTKSAMLYLSLCIIISVLSPWLSCCLLHPALEAVSCVAMETMHRKLGHTEFKIRDKKQNNGLLCGIYGLQVFLCFHMVISRRVGLCFPSHRLPKRSTSQCCQCFPPTENMQISREALVKICSAWQGICWSESPLALLMECVRQLLSPHMCPFYSPDKVLIFLFKGEFYSNLLWHESSTRTAGKERILSKGTCISSFIKNTTENRKWNWGKIFFSSSSFSFPNSW